LILVDEVKNEAPLPTLPREEMSFSLLEYAVICIVVPVLWGLAVVWASNRIERIVLRRRKGSKGRRKQALPPIEYHI